MHLEKKILAYLEQVYTVNFFYFEGKAFIGAGSEGAHPLYLIELESLKKTKIADGPGGTMSLAPVLINNTDLVSIMGLFPPFIGMDAGVYTHSFRSGNWDSNKIINLPFAHRCEIFNSGGSYYLFISSVSKFKENPEDWSNPGELYVVPLSDVNNIEGLSDPLIKNVYRNHGMIKTIIDGVETICISGSEGILAIYPDQQSCWRVEKIFDREVSEFAFFDLDNDGINELITIEPFHGNSLNIYDKTVAGWSHCYQSELSFGHGLSVGSFNENPSVVVGNRRGDRALNLFTVHGPVKNSITKSVIEEDAGPTQTKIFNYNSRDYILSSNQAKNEIALYSI